MSYNYMIISDDLESANDKIKEIIDSYKIDYEITKYDLDDDSLYNVIDELTTISLFDNPKAIIVKNINNMSSNSDNQILELTKAMNDLENQNLLIFLSLKSLENNEKINKVKQFCTTINVKIKGISFNDFIKNYCLNIGFKINENSINLLANYSTELLELKKSLEKLTTYKADSKEINDKDIKALIAPPLDDNVFELVEAVLNDDKRKIFTTYEDLKLQNVLPSYLISLLISKFQEVYNVSALVKSGFKQSDIEQLFNVSKGRAYYMMKNAKVYKKDIIKAKLNSLNKLDFDIKSGLIDQYLGLELFFLK